MNPLFILIPILNTAYQVFLKMATHGITPWLWLAIICEGLAFVLWMQILAKHDLSKAFPLSAIGYVLVLGSGWLIFNEEIKLMQIIGSLFIMLGVYLIGTKSKGTKI